MGEIADMMLDGTLDCETGEYLGEGDGFPRTWRDLEPFHPLINSGRKTNRKMGKATKHLLLKMNDMKKQYKAEQHEMSRVFALKSRGFAADCKRYGFYELTEEGKNKAFELSS